MGRKISVSILRSKDACDVGIEAFRKAFGDETVFSPTEELAAILAADYELDLYWGVNLLLTEKCPDFFRVKSDLKTEYLRIEREEWEKFRKEEDEFYALPSADQKDENFPVYVSERPNVIEARIKFKQEEALRFLKLYEEQGIGEKVEESLRT